MSLKKDIESINNTVQSLKQELSKVIVGHDDIIEQLIIAMLANGHCLLVGVPGLAKTLMIQSIAKIIGSDFKRIQFTPDLMPSDILGTEIISVDDKGEKSFKFLHGPVFTNILLADEINRTPPKTQAALLEAMQEKEVTIGGHTQILQSPFFVLATQNPIEQEGTYPLPEAQLDRFMFQLTLDYPDFDNEVKIVETTMIGKKAELENLNLSDKLVKYQQIFQDVDVEANVIEYAVKLVQMTRHQSDSKYKDLVRYGAGPRASQYLVQAAKILAVIKGDVMAEQKHVNQLALSVLSHRVMLSFTGEAEGWTVEKLISSIIEDIN